LIVVFSSVVYIHLASSSSVVLFEPSSHSSYILILRILIVWFRHLIAVLVLNSFLS
jgi:hypothetical protein